MSFVVGCQCGKQFKVADEQRGKKAKCPGCGTTLRLEPKAAAAAPPPPPPPMEDDDPFANFDLEAAAKMEREAVVDESQAPRSAPPPLKQDKGDGGPRQKPCPSCGSMISAFAMRCVNCGATFNPAAAPAKGGRGGGGRAGAAAASADADMSLVEWLLCILFAGIGCIVGIVYLIQGKPKGGKMIAVSLIVAVLSNVIFFLIAYLSAPGAMTTADGQPERDAPPVDTACARRRRRHWEMLSICAAALVLSAVLTVRDDGRVAVPGFAGKPLPPVCMSQQVFGVKCPGCGLTRSFVHLAHGRWEAASNVHRLGWLIFLAAVVQIPYRLLSIYLDRPLLGRRAAVAFSWTLIALLVGNWAVEMMA